ncbi:MAG: formyl transferase [Candidatus Aenigmarchaeota archaeon]|nr:formyl transferase [Candidatus Aenigmarchaeota archaeon]
MVLVAYAQSGLKKLYDPGTSQRPMRVIDMMSGSGTNVVKTIEYQHGLAAKRGKSPYEVVAIFTDNKGSKAQQLAENFSLPWECDDITDFYAGRGHPNKRDLSLRPAYFERVIRKLEQYKPDAIVLGGFMSVVTEPFLSWCLGVNVHPADLSIAGNNGPKYTGDNAVLNQILAGETELRSSTHIVRERVDQGEVLMVSEPLAVDLERAAEELFIEGKMRIDERAIGLGFLRKPQHSYMAIMVAGRHQDWLKQKGDWAVLPQTVEWIADGRFALGPDGVYVDGLWTPNGYRL